MLAPGQQDEIVNVRGAVLTKHTMKFSSSFGLLLFKNSSLLSSFWIGVPAFPKRMFCCSWPSPNSQTSAKGEWHRVPQTLAVWAALDSQRAWQNQSPCEVKHFFQIKLWILGRSSTRRGWGCDSMPHHCPKQGFGLGAWWLVCVCHWFTAYGSDFPSGHCHDKKGFPGFHRAELNVSWSSQMRDWSQSLPWAAEQSKNLRTGCHWRSYWHL